MLREPSKTGRMGVEIPEGESVPTWSNNMARLDGVLWAEPDVVDTAQFVPNDTEYGSQWSPAIVRAEAAWDVTTGTDTVIIGVIDSGISMNAAGLDHEDLNDAGRFTLGTDFVNGGTPLDDNMHGTHVVGIAAAPGNTADGIAGMNWDSPVYICRTLDANGNGSSADFAAAVEEITDFAVAHDKKAVINYSAGGGDNQTKRDACDYADSHGMLLVAATGNDNGGPVISPASLSVDFDGVIAVGSTDADDTVSSFSNVGPEVTVVAPGRDIHSTMPVTATARMIARGLSTMYDSLNGTSMASPLVAGVAGRRAWCRQLQQCVGLRASRRSRCPGLHQVHPRTDSGLEDPDPLRRRFGTMRHQPARGVLSHQSTGRVSEHSDQELLVRHHLHGANDQSHLPDGDRQRLRDPTVEDRPPVRGPNDDQAGLRPAVTYRCGVRGHATRQRLRCPTDAHRARLRHRSISGRWLSFDTRRLS